MKISLTGRIKLGVAFIKGVYGLDALQKINAQTLALNDGSSCVLGQLGGDYAKETRRLNLSRPVAYMFGFITKGGLSYSKEERAFDALNRAWKREVSKAV